MRFTKPWLSEPRFKVAGPFTQWLETPCREKTGDDYYWLHQQQLQNSALQFKPLNKVNKLDLQELGKEEPTVNREINKADFAPRYALSLAQSQAVTKDYGCKISTQDFAELINIIHEKIDQYIPAINPGLSQKKTMPSQSPEPLANKTLTSPLSYKNHQLFINSNEAELSLNGVDLSKEQLKELSLLVKQWLNKKGIKLGQIIINGVKQ